MNAFEELESVLASNAQEVFGARGSAVELAGKIAQPSAWPEEVVVASIGFAANKLRGSLALLAPRSVVHGFRPGVALSDLLMCDLLGEIANMLIGRAKNQLLSRRVSLHLGLPATMIARIIRLMPSDLGAQSSWHEFSVAGERVQLQINAALDADFEFSRAVDESEQAVGTDGDVLFF